MKKSECYQKQMEKLNRDILHHQNVHLRKEYRKWKITDIQYQVLNHIYEKEQCTIGSCANALHQDAGNMSALCKKLEHMNYITRKRKPQDERIVEVSLSESGIACMNDITVRIKNIYDKQWNTYNEKDKDLILNGLMKLNQYIELFTNENEKEGK